MDDNGRMIFLESKTITLSPPTQAKIVSTISGSYLDVAGEGEPIEVSPEQLINDFSGIKRERDIEAFAYKYGQLLEDEEKEYVDSWLNLSLLVRKILMLRKALLKRKNVTEIIGTNDTWFIWLEDNRELSTRIDDIGETVWVGEERLFLPLEWEKGDEETDEQSLRLITPLLIKNEIVPLIDVRIDFYEPEMVADLVHSGDGFVYKEDFDFYQTRFVLKERKYAPTLLSAIFYHLWGIVNSDRDIHECEECGRPTIIRRKRDHIYCGGACKKRAERMKKSNG